MGGHPDVARSRNVAGPLRDYSVLSCVLIGTFSLGGAERDPLAHPGDSPSRTRSTRSRRVVTAGPDNDAPRAGIRAVSTRNGQATAFRIPKEVLDAASREDLTVPRCWQSRQAADEWGLSALQRGRGRSTAESCHATTQIVKDHSAVCERLDGAAVKRVCAVARPVETPCSPGAWTLRAAPGSSASSRCSRDAHRVSKPG